MKVNDANNTNKKITVALVGNPNCGKTTLFNALTGRRNRTGNWAGVTLDSDADVVRNSDNVVVVDLPGTYALNGSSPEQKEVVKYLKSTPPDCVINLIDANHLERSLYLTVELLSLNIPVVVAINFASDMEFVEISKNVSNRLGVPVVSVEFIKNMKSDYLSSVIDNAEFKTRKNANKKLPKSPIEKQKFISLITSDIIVKNRTKKQNLTQKIDKVITNKYLWLPIFFVVITLTYGISIRLGGVIGGEISKIVGVFREIARTFFIEKGVSEIIIGVFCEAILGGVGGIITFLPQVFLLFFMMGLLEESGYLPRIAFVLDGIFSRFNLSGKSVMCMILSSGCAVSGICASRTIESESERKATIFITSFIPCSAKTAVFAYLSVAFFGGSALVASSLYFLGILVALISGATIKKLKLFDKEKAPFILELPLYKIPKIRVVLAFAYERAKEFLIKAGTVIFGVSVGIWILKSFGFSGYVGAEIEKSFLCSAGKILAPIFWPLGFGTWQGTASLLAGTLAKEAVIEALMLTCSDVRVLFNGGHAVYAFAVFITLSPPCVSALSSAKRELGNGRLFTKMILFQTVVAYAVSFMVNGIGELINGNGLLFSIWFGIIIVSLGATAILQSIKSKSCRFKSSRRKTRCKKRYTT